MTLRAPDVKDEHGWQVLNDDGAIVGHATSRDKARKAAAGARGFMVPFEENGQPAKPDDHRLDIDRYGAMIQAEPDRDVEDFQQYFGPQPEKVEGTVIPTGRDLTPEETKASEAHNVSLVIKDAARQIRELWVDLARALYVFHQGKMWEKLGVESFEAYCADPDVDLTVTDAYGWVAAWQQLVVDRGVDPDRLKGLGSSKVQKILPAVRREQVTVDEALADVEALPKSALVDKYSGRTATKGKPDTDSKIRTDNEPALGKCPVCGKMGRMDAETGEFIK